MKTINIKGLSQYCVSEDGKVFRGEKEIRGFFLNGYTFGLRTDYHDIPMPFSLEEIYKSTYGKTVPKKVTENLLKEYNLRIYKEIILLDDQKRRISFPTIEYALRFLRVTEKTLVKAIFGHQKVKGFVAMGVY